MQIIKLTDKNRDEVIKKACEVLNCGGLVVYPTETCYGLGADVTSQEAIIRLLKYKKRREGKPLSVLVSSLEMADEYVEVNDSAKIFYENFLPGPVTVISKSKGKVVNGVESEIGTLGIRISSHNFAMDLSKSIGKGITATSANASYKKKPYSIDDLLSPLSDKQKEKLDLIIDAGILPKRKASTVVDTSLVSGMILRKGDIDFGKKAFEFLSKSEEDTKNLAKTMCLKNWNKIRKNGLVFGLIGELGVGKTIFAKGVGEFLKIKDVVVSPSYNLLNEYEWEKHDVKGKFFHFDPWRMESFEDFLKLGFRQMVGENNVIVIEWANKYVNDLERICKDLSVKFVKLGFEEIGEMERKVRIVN